MPRPSFAGRRSARFLDKSGLTAYAAGVGSGPCRSIHHGLTLMDKRLPTFLGIGAHKAGTTWLFEQLRSHPDIWLPAVKELHFFDRSLRYPSPNTLATSSPLGRILGSEPWERPRMIEGLKSVAEDVKHKRFGEARWRSKWLFGHYNEDWYRGLFSPGMTHSSCGEITPSYSILEDEDVARIKMTNPDVKLIFMIRNPIERAWSAIRAKTKLNLVSDDEIIAVLKRPAMVVRGNYERTLEVYLRHFDSRQVLVCFYDAIRQDKVGLMAAVTDFLGVRRFSNCAIDNQKRVGASPPRKMPSKTREYLSATYAPMIEKIARAYGSYARQWESATDSGGPASTVNDQPLHPAFHP